MSGEINVFGFGDFGSESYFKSLNKKYNADEWAKGQIYSQWDYDKILKGLATNVSNILKEMENDVKNNCDILRFLPDDSRKNLVTAVEQWGKVVQISSQSSSSCNTCTSYLNLRENKTKMQSNYSKSKMEEFASTALKLASTSKALEYVKEAMNKGVESAIGTNRNYDETKAKFFASIGGGSSKSFYKDLYYCMEYKQHSSSYKGGCGYTIGSKYYIEYYEKKGLKKESISAWSNYGYYEYVKNRVKKIGEHITEIATKYKKDETVYIKAENKEHLELAIKTLNKYDASINSSVETVIKSKPKNIKSKNEDLLFSYKSKLGNVTKPIYGVCGYGIAGEIGLGISLSYARYYVIDSKGREGICRFAGIGGGIGGGVCLDTINFKNKQDIYELESHGVFDYELTGGISVDIYSASLSLGVASDKVVGRRKTELNVEPSWDLNLIPELKDFNPKGLKVTMGGKLLYGTMIAYFEKEY